MHSAKAKSRKATKEEIANAKLTQTMVSMGHRMQCNISCPTCIHFETCPKAGKQDYCLYRPGRYVSKNLMQ